MSEWVIIQHPERIVVETRETRQRQMIREMNMRLRGFRQLHRCTCPVDHGWH